MSDTLACRCGHRKDEHMPWGDCAGDYDFCVCPEYQERNE